MSSDITFQGNPLTLENSKLVVNSKMPDFTLIKNDLSNITLTDMSGVKVFLTVPSLDTDVCDIEVKKFNAKAAQLENVSIYCVSNDLPFAQSRWCGTNGITNVSTLSDYATREFGKVTGTLIKELALLTRAVFVVDEDNTIQYVEYLKEITNEPDYDAAYNAILKLVK